MGLNISSTRYVDFDDTHQKRINTSLEANPTISMVSGIAIRHVFRRNKTGDKDRDGNPLIYALKGMHGYRIMPIYKERFLDRAKQIVGSFAADIDADFVMPLPSSYGLCQEVADLVCEVSGKDCLDPAFIRKKTIEEMLQQYGEVVPGGLNARAAGMYKSQLATWRRSKLGQHVSMKEIDPAIRNCFHPLTLAEEAPDLGGRKVVIVDDLMSTGASIASTATILQGLGCEVTSGISFVSGL